MRIHHRGVIDVIPVFVEDRLRQQRLYVDVGLHQRRQMRRQRAHFGRLNTVGVHQASHFHAATLRQVVDEIIVAHIAVHHAWLAGPDGVHDGAGILAGWFHLYALAALIALQLLMPVGQLLDAAFRVFIQRHFIVSDKVIAARLDKPWRIFREMLRRFGDKVAQLFEHFVADDVFATRVAVQVRLRRPALGVGLQQVGIETDVAAIRELFLQRQIERHMVDSRAAVA